jgi:hypothetical protein
MAVTRLILAALFNLLPPHLCAQHVEAADTSGTQKILLNDSTLRAPFTSHVITFQKFQNTIMFVI